VTGLEPDLEKAAAAAAAHSALEDQNQESMMPKEIIDRPRFEMDELRTMAAAWGSGAGRESGSSREATIAALTAGCRLIGTRGQEKKFAPPSIRSKAVTGSCKHAVHAVLRLGQVILSPSPSFSHSKMSSRKVS
jgi:hypothetical protein